MKEAKGPTLKTKLDEAMSSMGPMTPMTEASSSLCIICLDDIMANLDGTIKGEDPEYLHDMRVSSRRLRAALRVYGRCYPTVLERAQDRAKAVTDLLGQVRDLDVRMIHLQNIKGLLSEQGDRGAELLIFTSSMQWELARQKMIKGLVELKKGPWHSWMSNTLSNPSIPKGRPWYPAVHALPTIETNRAAVKATSHLAKLEEALSAQHELRITIKKYRYSLELLKFCFNKGLDKLLRRCKRLQDDLGLMHDYDILIDHILASRSRTLPKNIKKGLDELKGTIVNLRHQQFELFMKHIDPFVSSEPLDLRL